MVLRFDPDWRRFEGSFPEAGDAIRRTVPARASAFADVHDAPTQTIGPGRLKAALMGPGQRVCPGESIGNARALRLLHHR
jgi:hypothetical protein